MADICAHSGTGECIADATIEEREALRDQIAALTARLQAAETEAVFWMRACSSQADIAREQNDRANAAEAERDAALQRLQAAEAWKGDFQEACRQRDAAEAERDSARQEIATLTSSVHVLEDALDEVTAERDALCSALEGEWRAAICEGCRVNDPLVTSQSGLPLIPHGHQSRGWCEAYRIMHEQRMRSGETIIQPLARPATPTEAGG